MRAVHDLINLIKWISRNEWQWAYGLARCTWRGLDHFRAYVWSEVDPENGTRALIGTGPFPSW
jgi:hypothetical protein